MLRETMIIDISLHVLLQAAHTFCVSVLYVHVVFDDKHVLNLMCVRACMCLPQIKLIFICIYIFLMLTIDLFLLCLLCLFRMNVHVLNIL